MSLLEQIQHEVLYLPPEKQQEVLDFVRFLRERLTVRQPARRAPPERPPCFWLLARPKSGRVEVSGRASSRVGGAG